MFIAGRHLIQLLGDFLGYVFLTRIIIVIRVVLINVIAVEALLLELFAILRVELLLPGGNNLLLLLCRLVLVQSWNAVELIPRERAPLVDFLRVGVNKVEFVFFVLIIWTLVADFGIAFSDQ